jgi:hypothetical protein
LDAEHRQGDGVAEDGTVGRSAGRLAGPPALLALLAASLALGLSGAAWAQRSRSGCATSSKARHHHRRRCSPRRRNRAHARAHRARFPTASAWLVTDRTPHASWNGDFAGGDFSQYDQSPAFHPDGNPLDYALVSAPVPPGFSFAFRATVGAGSSSVVAGQDGERTLLTVWPGAGRGVRGRSRAYQGADSWYRDELYFPATFKPSRETSWNWLFELHDYPNGPCCANLALSVVTNGADHGPRGHERLSVRIEGGGSPARPLDSGAEQALYDPDARVHWIAGPEIELNHWYVLVWHVHWDWRLTKNGGRGRVDYWIDGRRIGTYIGPTLFYYRSLRGPGQAYLQIGYYRPTDQTAGYGQPTVSVYHAGTMIGPTGASIGVAPA